MKSSSIVIIASILFGSLLFFGAFSTVQALEDFYEVVAVEKAGYLAYPDRGLKKSLLVGTRLHRGDTIAVNRGNYVQIAIDEGHRNVLHMQGEALAELTGSVIRQIDLSAGEVYVLLGHLKTVSELQVDTPSASIYAKDAYVKIKTTGLSTEARVYKGSASISGRLANGVKMSQKVTLRAGEKASVQRPGENPSTPSRMEEREFNEIKDILRANRFKKQVLVFPEIYADQQPALPSSDSKDKHGKADRKFYLSR